MSKFTIQAVEALDYDFTEIPSGSGKGKCKGKGTVLEPTTNRLEEYQDAVKQLFPSDLDPESMTEDELKKHLEKEIADNMEPTEFMNRMLDLTADLCGGTPTAEQLQDLPPRYQAAFLAWIQKELTNPEA